MFIFNISLFIWHIIRPFPMTLSLQCANMKPTKCAKAWYFTLEQSQGIANQAEKKQRAFDKTIDEWKTKAADLQSELENSQRESRSNAAEVYKLRAQIEEGQDGIESLRRENKNLSGQYYLMFCIFIYCHYENILINIVTNIRNKHYKIVFV